MILEKEMNNGVLTVYLEGELNTSTVSQVEKDMAADIAVARQLILNMKSLRHLSSAGLRLIIKLNKVMKNKDGMIVTNVNESIMEVFKVTGFVDFLRIE